MSTAIVLRSANRVNDSTFERIYKFYYEKSDIELKEKEEEIRTRLINIWSLLGDILTDRKAVLAHVQWCQDQGYKIKERIAYEDLRYARALFGDSRKQSKEAQRAVVSEWLMWGIEKAKATPDLYTFQLLIKRYNILNGLEGDSAAVPFNRPAVVINFNADPETLKQQIINMRKDAEQAMNTIDITPE